MAASLRSFVITAVVLASSFAVTCVVHLAPNPDGHAFASTFGAYRVLWPQRWNFFTHLDEEQLVAYRLDGSGCLVSMYQRDQEGPLMGLNRSRDVHMSGAVHVAERIPGRYWQERVDSPAGCARPLDPTFVHTVELRASPAELCGSVVIAAERFRPPSGGTRRVIPQKNVRLAVVDLRCTQ